MVETIADIDAQIEWPELLNRLIPDVTFGWIEEGLTDLQDFQEVTGLNVALDTDVELVITGGGDADLFDISQDGTTLKALREFDHDALDDDLVPGVLSVELALRDGEDNLFDRTRAYIVVRPDDTSGHPFAETTQQIRDALESYWTALQSGDLDLSDLGDLLETIGLADQVNELLDVPDADFLAVLLLNFWGEIQPYVQAFLNGDIDLSDLIDRIYEVTASGASGSASALLDPGSTIENVELPGASALNQISLSDVQGVLSQHPEIGDALAELRDLLQNGVQEQDADGAANDLLLASRDGGELPGGLGSDLFFGHTDNDWVRYDGLRADFVHDELAPGLVAIHKPAGESDLLLGIEQVVFDDGSLVFDIESDCVEFVYRIYEACFDRAPDLGGLTFWTGVADWIKEKHSVQAAKDFLADQFVMSQEFRERFGDNPSHGDYIDAMYQHALGREADAEGRAWWVDGMNKGLGYDDILIAFTDCEEHIANTLPNMENGLWVV